MKTLRDIYEDYAEPGLPFEIFKGRLYDFFVDLDGANAFAGRVWGPDDIINNLEATE